MDFKGFADDGVKPKAAEFRNGDGMNEKYRACRCVPIMMGPCFLGLLSLLTAFPKHGAKQNPSLAPKAELANLSHILLPSVLLSPTHSHLPAPASPALFMKETVLIRSSVPLKAAAHK